MATMEEASFDSAALNGIAAVTSKVHTEQVPEHVSGLPAPSRCVCRAHSARCSPSQFVHAVVDATVAHTALSALSRTFAVGPAAPESAFITGIAAATSEAFSKAVGAGLSPAEVRKLSQRPAAVHHTGRPSSLHSLPPSCKPLALPQRWQGCCRGSWVSVQTISGRGLLRL